MIHALTFDVEDYYQVAAFAGRVRFSDWDKFESRVVDSTTKILDILAENRVSATFFVLGWVGEHYPALVKEIKKRGHEIASHGYNHRLVYEQGPEEFRRDIRKSREILEGIIQEKVIGYRAPNYSITRQTPWALDILAEEGFGYDSSIFPIYHQRGGMPGAGRYLQRIECSGRELLEFPLSTLRVAGYNVPFAGGGYFRLFPYRLIKWGIRRIEKTDCPAIIFMHPWEFDPHQPRLEGSFLTRFKHYLNLSGSEKKLRNLLRDFEFAPAKEILTTQESGVRIQESE